MTIYTFTEFEELIRNQKIYHYKVDDPDREYPRVLWNVYGIPAKNLIVVTASCRNQFIGASDESFLLEPAMIDRWMFIDVADYMLADRISQEIWELYRDELLRN